MLTLCRRAVGIAQARIDRLGCDVRRADAASTATDLIRERPRTATDQWSKREDPNTHASREPRVFMPRLPALP
jgi:hypothetical protein